MIIVCEIVCWGSEHVSFDAGMLQIILAAFPGERLAFFGEHAHIELMRAQMGPELAARVSWKPISIPPRRAKYLQRLYHEVRLLRSLFRELRQTSMTHLLLLDVMPSTLLALKLCKSVPHAGLPVQVVLHGGLSGMGNDRSRHPLRRMQDMKTAIGLFGRRGVQYLALEETIREFLLRNARYLTGSVEVLEHPVPPNEFDESSPVLGFPIRFGFLGMANAQKGFPVFVRLASEIAIGKRAEFHALGKFPNGTTAIPGLEALTSRPVSQHLERHDYVHGIKRLHFTVFPFDADHYALSPSGTLLDAVSWAKPLIGARIPLVEKLFDRYGDIGYMFSSYEELRRIVEEIIREPDPSTYARQARNLRKCREDRIPGALAETYREICAKAAFLSDGSDFCSRDRASIKSASTPSR